VQLGETAALVVGHEQLHRLERGKEAALDRLAKLGEPLPLLGGDLNAPGVAEAQLPTAALVEDVDLVQRQQPGTLGSADLGQHVVHRRQHLAELTLGDGGIRHVHDQVGAHGFLQGRGEGVHQLVRELSDEADGVGQEVAPAAYLEGPGRGVERVEEALPHLGVGAGEGVQEGRLAGVRVAGERHRRECRAFTLAAHGPARPLGLGHPPLERRDTVAGEAAVGLDLALAGTSGPDAAVDAPGAQAFEVGPQPPHPSQVVLELCELNLELALGRVGVVGEDVEDDRGAVDHRHAERLLEVALLARQELVVAGDQVGVRLRDRSLQRRELALAEVAVGIGLWPALGELARDRHAGGPEQLPQLRKVRLLGSRRDAERALPGPRVVDPVAVTLHSPQV